VRRSFAIILAEPELLAVLITAFVAAALTLVLRRLNMTPLVIVPAVPVNFAMKALAAEFVAIALNWVLRAIAIIIKPPVV
jgi:hypothetical protein